MTENERNELQKEALELCESAWGVIANAGAGNWSRESFDWNQAACGWRDRYHALRAKLRPTLDVQQGPSGRWYRLQDEKSDETTRVARHYSEGEAYADTNRCFGVKAGDEAAVAELLQRHAARRLA